jgi:hypothetical protein
LKDEASVKGLTPQSTGTEILEVPTLPKVIAELVQPAPEVQVTVMDDIAPSSEVIGTAPGLSPTSEDEFHLAEEGNASTTDASGSRPAIPALDVSNSASESTTLYSEPSRSSTSRVDLLKVDSPRSEPFRPDTPRAFDRSMAKLFAKTKDAKVVYTDDDLNRIATYLKSVGRPTWSVVPRLYTVLRLIDQLDMLDTFVEQGITDIFFPFTLASLPNTLSPTARARFVDTQNAVLSKSFLFEKDSDRKHTNFRQDEPLPFEIVAILGSGAHGQVHKVMSTLSNRVYARKQFRRRGSVSKDAIKSFLIELQVLKRVQHYHCIELVSFITH